MGFVCISNKICSGPKFTSHRGIKIFFFAKKIKIIHFWMETKKN